MNKNSLKVTVSFSKLNIVSSNNHLAARIRKYGVKYIPYLSLTDDAKQFKEYSSVLLVGLNIDFNSLKELFCHYSKFKTVVKFSIKEDRYFKCDLTNLKKLFEDEVVLLLKKNNLRFDDSMIIESVDSKIAIESSVDESIEYTIIGVE